MEKELAQVVLLTRNRLSVLSAKTFFLSKPLRSLRNMHIVLRLLARVFESAGNQALKGSKDEKALLTFAHEKKETSWQALFSSKGLDFSTRTARLGCSLGKQLKAGIVLIHSEWFKGNKVKTESINSLGFRGWMAQILEHLSETVDDYHVSNPT